MDSSVNVRLSSSAKEFIQGQPNILANRLFRRQMSIKSKSGVERIEKSLLPRNKAYVVIKFSEKAKKSTMEDVERIIQQFGMLTTLEILSKTEKYLYVSATNDTFLKLADEAQLIKKTITGTMQKFNYFSISDFLVGDLTEETVIRNSERPILIKDAIKPSLLPYFRNGTIEHFFPLHDLKYLERFERKFMKKLPADYIRNYFGTSIGLYFAFIEFYTIALVIPAIFGTLQWLLNFNLATVCGFFVIWSAIFTELWKRRCSGLAYQWGTIEMTSLDTQIRTNYYGEMKPDPITGKMTLQYPIKYTYIQMYCISYPVVVLCIIAAAYFALYQFQIEAEVTQDFGTDSPLLYVPVVVQSILTAIFSWAYEKLATFLTELENHRTRSQYDRHRVTKLMLFEIVNNFFSLFYIAFVLQDLNQLQYQLMMQLMIFQIAQIAQEVGYPLIAVLKQMYTKRMREELNDMTKEKIIDKEQYEQAFYESGLDKYNSTYEDYLQICTQFGYVVLFAAVAPFAALGALINNIFAIHVDIFKLVNIYQRPFARRAKNIGAWQSALELLSVMSILSNCGLLYLQPNVRQFMSNLYPTMADFSFVIFEHILLALKYSLHKAIHDKPRWVRIAVAKADYESSQAFKHLRKFKATNKLKKII